MILNDADNMIASQWHALNNRFPFITLREYVVMPNHFHGIIEFVGAIPCGSHLPKIPALRLVM
ncbi:MAG: hypothetical protein QX199_05140 [Methylococcaceae bacterium]